MQKQERSPGVERTTRTDGRNVDIEISGSKKRKLKRRIVIHNLRSDQIKFVSRNYSNLPHPKHTILPYTDKLTNIFGLALVYISILKVYNKNSNKDHRVLVKNRYKESCTSINKQLAKLSNSITAQKY